MDIEFTLATKNQKGIYQGILLIMINNLQQRNEKKSQDILIFTEKAVY